MDSDPKTDSILKITSASLYYTLFMPNIKTRNFNGLDYDATRKWVKLTRLEI